MANFNNTPDPSEEPQTPQNPEIPYPPQDRIVKGEGEEIDWNTTKGSFDFEK